ncbi:MAG: glycosyltransferase family 4 protein [Planctomycetota bacterium]
MPENTHKSGSAPDAGERKTKLVILNQYYVPDVASTGYLLHELATELARTGFEVEVLTSRPSYGPRETWQDAPLREERDGVKIRRLWTTRFSKDSLLGRATNYLTFVVQLTLAVLMTSSSKKVYLYTTNPPFMGVIGGIVSLFRRHSYVVLLHDAYPHLATWVGTIRKGGIAEKLWHMANKLSYGRAKETIVLCQAAKRLVRDTYGATEEHVHVIPNWASGDALRPLPKRDNPFANEHNLQDEFVLLYSGNIGLYYDFATVLDAAELLLDEPFRLVMIGSGGKREKIAAEVERRGLKNVTMLPYQPIERLNESLNACDASLVSIAEGIEGISFPSKLYSALAVGKPVLALSEHWSELRPIVETNACGLWTRLGDAEQMAEHIRGLINDPQRAESMGRAARELFERRYTCEVCSARYGQVLRMSDPLVEQAESDRLRAEIAAQDPTDAFVHAEARTPTGIRVAVEEGVGV